MSSQLRGGDLLSDQRGEGVIYAVTSQMGRGDLLSDQSEWWGGGGVYSVTRFGEGGFTH